MNLTRLINQNSENLPSSHSGPGTGQHPGLPAHHARLTAAALHRSAHLVHVAHHQSVGHNRLAWDDGLMAHQTIIGRICCCMPCWLCIDTMVLFMSPDKFMGAICIWRGWPPIETPPHELCSELLIVVMLSLMMLLCGGTTLPPPSAEMVPSGPRCRWTWGRCWCWRCCRRTSQTAGRPGGRHSGQLGVLPKSRFILDNENKI